MSREEKKIVYRLAFTWLGIYMNDNLVRETMKRINEYTKQKMDALKERGIKNIDELRVNVDVTKRIAKEYPDIIKNICVEIEELFPIREKSVADRIVGEWVRNHRAFFRAMQRKANVKYDVSKDGKIKNENSNPEQRPQANAIQNTNG